MDQKPGLVLSKKEFFATLKKCKSEFDWELRSNGEIIGHADGKKFDVVSALWYYVSQGRYCPLWKSRRVAKRLGMSEELRTTIVRASCNVLISRDDRNMRATLMAMLINAR